MFIIILLLVITVPKVQCHESQCVCKTDFCIYILYIPRRKDKQSFQEQQDVQVESCSAYNVVVADREPDIEKSNTVKLYENVF